ncbi:unnamed protein product [Caenorhabditis nigoni]
MIRSQMRGTISSNSESNLLSPLLSYLLALSWQPPTSEYWSSCGVFWTCSMKHKALDYEYHSSKLKRKE